MNISARFTLAIAAALSCSSGAAAQRAFPVDFRLQISTNSVRTHLGTPSGATTQGGRSSQVVEFDLVGQNSGLGLAGRYQSGDGGSGRSSNAYDAMVLLGDKSFHLELGYAQRTLVQLDTSFAMIRAGFSTVTHLGMSGVAMRTRAGFARPVKQYTGGKLGPEYWEGETGVSYTWDRLPIFAQLGYRMSRLKANGYDEERSSVILGAGFWFWSR